MFSKALFAAILVVWLLTTGGFALAQSVSVSVSPSPIGEGTGGTITMTFRGLPPNTDLEFHGCVSENSQVTARSLSCEGANLGSFMPMSTGNSGTLTRTGIITGSCPVGQYTLEVEVRIAGGATLATTIVSFAVGKASGGAGLSGAFVRLGAIGLVYRKYDPELNVEIWGITPESEGLFLLRVTQSQIDAAQPQGLVASTADGRVAVHVGAEPDRNVTISMGPTNGDPANGKVHHVILANGLNGKVISTIDTKGGPPGLVTSSITARNAPAAAPPVVPQTARVDGSIIHIVRAGDTINTIAQAYGVNPQAIVERNQLTHGGRWIYPGQELVIRDATATVVDDTGLPELPTPVYAGDDE